MKPTGRSIAYQRRQNLSGLSAKPNLPFHRVAPGYLSASAGSHTLRMSDWDVNYESAESIRLWRGAGLRIGVQALPNVVTADEQWQTAVANVGTAWLILGRSEARESLFNQGSVQFGRNPHESYDIVAAFAANIISNYIAVTPTPSKIATTLRTFEGEVQAVNGDVATVAVKQIPAGELLIGKCRNALLTAKNIGIRGKFRLLVKRLDDTVFVEFEKSSRGSLSAQEVQAIRDRLTGI
jgi:hypothetical protein